MKMKIWVSWEQLRLSSIASKHLVWLQLDKTTACWIHESVSSYHRSPWPELDTRRGLAGNSRELELVDVRSGLHQPKLK